MMITPQQRQAPQDVDVVPQEAQDEDGGVVVENRVVASHFAPCRAEERVAERSRERARDRLRRSCQERAQTAGPNWLRMSCVTPSGHSLHMTRQGCRLSRKMERLHVC